MDDLAGRGIHLRLRNGIVPWTVADELPTIAEQRAVHQLAKALKTIIEKSSGA
jgi:hypothetical protein